jgi:hypothetical protein
MLTVLDKAAKITGSTIDDILENALFNVMPADRLSGIATNMVTSAAGGRLQSNVLQNIAVNLRNSLIDVLSDVGGTSYLDGSKYILKVIEDALAAVEYAAGS